MLPPFGGRPMSRSAKRLPLGLTALLVAAAFAGGVLFSRPLQAGRFNPYQKLGVFTKVLSYIETHYVEDISETELMYGAARGLTDVLDPHSRFMDPEEYDRLKKETEGNEEINGIGIDVEKRKNRLVIISPIEGSPAARAGIEPGDVIKRVDGVEVANLEFDDAVSRMQGPPGSEVVLVIDRRGRELTFRLRRSRYELKSVEGRMLEDGIGYVKIRLFAATTDQLLGDLLDQLEAQSKGLRGLVLDLRRNPGGLLDPSEADAPRERDLQKRLRNEQGENVVQRKRLDDYQLQMALDYLRSWSVFAKQLTAR